MTSALSSKPTLADTLLFATACLWGINFAVVKVALVDFPPLLFTGLRLVLAVSAILLWIRWAGPALRFERRHWLQLIIVGLLANTAYQLLFIFGINFTTADNTALIMATLPVWVAIMGTIAGQDRIVGPGWVGITISVVGIGLIIIGSDRQAQLEFGGATLRGDFLVLLAALSWALYSLALRPLTHHYSSEAITGLAMPVGAIPVILLTLPAMTQFAWSQVSVGGWLALFYSGVFSIALPYFFWNYGVSQLGSARTSLYLNLVPPIALVTAWLWLGETLTWLQVGGGLLALVGVALARRNTFTIR